MVTYCKRVNHFVGIKYTSYRVSPENGKVLDLPFLGRLLQVELPTPFKSQLLETTPFDMNKLKPDIQVRPTVQHTQEAHVLIVHYRSWHHYLLGGYTIILEIF